MGFFDRWPLLRQLRRRADGNGLEAASARTRELAPRTKGAEVTRSICPYCAVGCGQLVHHRDGELLAIEGDPESPINAGTLCPKGAASHQLLTHERRLTRVRYRPPGATRWQDLDLDRALDMIADRVWETRARTFVATDEDGRRLNHTTAIAHLGGATLDNEENYLIRKLFTGGLGMVAVSNQARI
ncbi:MAG: dehydrogenase [Planctomycetes bacterium]|nr:dehydrogenase [Planctomycetota bacterium]